MSFSALLSDPLLSLWSQPVTGLEIIAFVSGLASVWLTYRMHIANWPLGMVSVSCYAWLFFHARLYADASLQIAFLVLCAYGWWRWLQGRSARGHIAVNRAPLRECALVGGITLAAILGVALLLHVETDSPAPLLDASVFSLSLAATYGQARARLESWWLWIAVDLISIPLYWSRSLPLTAFLYVLFLLICLRGLAGWNSQLRKQVAA